MQFHLSGLHFHLRRIQFHRRRIHHPIYKFHLSGILCYLSEVQFNLSEMHHPHVSIPLKYNYWCITCQWICSTGYTAIANPHMHNVLMNMQYRLYSYCQSSRDNSYSAKQESPPFVWSIALRITPWLGCRLLCGKGEFDLYGVVCIHHRVDQADPQW